MLYSGTFGKPLSDCIQIRLILLTGSDAISITTNGSVKPAQHMLTLVALESMTGSKTLVEALNHRGHCISYTTSEELETSLAKIVNRWNQMSPDDIQRPMHSTSLG